MPAAAIGLDKTLKALRQLDPDVYKRMNIEIRPSLQGIVKDARSMLPPVIGGLSNLSSKKPANPIEGASRAFPQYYTSQVKKGITYSLGTKRKLGNGWVSLYSIFNKSAMGQIMETAGTVNKGGQPWVGRKDFNNHRVSHSNNPKAGKWFIDHLESEIGDFAKVSNKSRRRGRIIYPAVKHDQGKVRATIFRAVDKAVAQANARINYGG